MPRSSKHPLTQAREAQNLTQPQLAKAVKLSVKTISKAENNQPIGAYSRGRLCKYFKTTALQLGLVHDHEKTEYAAPLDHGQEAESTSLSALAALDGTVSPLVPQPTKQDIIPEVYELGEQDLGVSRRQVLYRILNAACATFVLSPYVFTTARITQMATNYLGVDDEALSDLEAITQRYWKLRKNTSLNLFRGVVGHFQTVLQLLRQPQLEYITGRLYSIAGETAQILGQMLFDMHEYPLARSYYAFSLQAARTAHNTDLRAVGLGRMGLLSIYNEQPGGALMLVEESQHLPVQDTRISAWLAAVKAETYAQLDKFDACREALDTAEDLTSNRTFGEDLYATGFNQSRLLGYKGACFSHLGKTDLALSSLQQALGLLDPSDRRRQSMFFADIGIVLAKQGDVKGAYNFACKALAITSQTLSLSVLERIDTLRSTLEPWKDNGLVKALDQQVREMSKHIIVAKANILS